MAAPQISRFAPSPTGQPHPGTLLSALLVWLDAKQCGARTVLRLEDVDHTRSTPAFATAMTEAMAWLGLAWDVTTLQSSRRLMHEEVIDLLADMGRLYACTCSRKDRADGRRAADGSLIYDNRCRARGLHRTQWRASSAALRVRLPDTKVTVYDEGGRNLSQTPALDYGDPIVRSNNGAISYMLAVVADDAIDGTTRVVRGGDLALCTATQVALQQLLGYATPSYRHHPLLLGTEGGDKLAKLHGSLPLSHIQAAGISAPELCGMLAALVGLRSAAAPISPQELLGEFAWGHVTTRDVPIAWDAARKLLQRA